MDSDTVGFVLTFVFLILAVWWLVGYFTPQPPSLAVEYRDLQTFRSEEDAAFVRELMNPPAPQ